MNKSIIIKVVYQNNLLQKYFPKLRKIINKQNNNK